MPVNLDGILGAHPYIIKTGSEGSPAEPGYRAWLPWWSWLRSGGANPERTGSGRSELLGYNETPAGEGGSPGRGSSLEEWTAT